MTSVEIFSMTSSVKRFEGPATLIAADAPTMAGFTLSKARVDPAKIISGGPPILPIVITIPITAAIIPTAGRASATEDSDVEGACSSS